jgi:uncharacterized protein (DUF302 family)
MAEIQVTVRRFRLISSRPFEKVVSAIDAAVGHPDMSAFAKAVSPESSWAATQAFIQGALGESGFMEFVRFDLGAILRKESGQTKPKIVRIVIGNPLVMKEMAKHVADAASYAPVTVLIDERADGVHLSYDTMASLLAPYNNEQALGVAQALDRKVEKLLTEAASG